MRVEAVEPLFSAGYADPSQRLHQTVTEASLMAHSITSHLAVICIFVDFPSSLAVNFTADSLTFMPILLIKGLTGAVKSLTDADLAADNR